MDGKEESLGTDGNSFLGLFRHHVCNGAPPDKAVTFLMAMNTTHTNQENSALLSFNSDVKFWTYGIVTFEALKFFALDLYRIIVIQTSFITWLKSQIISNFEIQKLLKDTLEFGNHLDEHHVRNKGRRFRCLSLKWHMVKNTVKSFVRENNLPDLWNFTSRRKSK